MRQFMAIVENLSGTFYHVTDRDNAQNIVTNGFEGGWGDVGLGVYLYDNLRDAEAYHARNGWDGGLTDPVIIELKASVGEVERVIPDSSWDASTYANMWWHDMDDDETAIWFPSGGMRIIDA